MNGDNIRTALIEYNQVLRDDPNLLLLRQAKEKQLHQAIRETLITYNLGKKRAPGKDPPSEKSLNIYIRNFLKVYEECFAGDEKYVDNFEWITEIDTIQKWFEHDPLNPKKWNGNPKGASVPTRRNYITALLIVSLGCDKIPQKTYTEWELIREAVLEKLITEKALKSTNQESQYLDADIIIKEINSMGKNVRLIAKKSDITNEDRKLAQLWMILRILQVYHMRNEVATFKMISYREFKKLKEKTENYVVWNSGKGEWFISANVYKTSKKYGEKITIVDDKSLSKDLTLFRKINGWGIMFKNSFKTDSPLNPNDLSKLLAKWSGQVLPKIEVSRDDGETILKDRSISTTMLAKIFYSAEQGEVKQKLVKGAKARGHDIKTALNVYTATPEEVANLNSS
jgi:hypothetical protein